MMYQKFACTIQVLKFSKIQTIISSHFFKFFLSYRTINHSHKNSIQLTIQYKTPIQRRICIITRNQHSHIQKVNNNSCRRNCSNLMIFLSIRLHNAANPQIKYIHNKNNNMVLNIIITFQNHITLVHVP